MDDEDPNESDGGPACRSLRLPPIRIFGYDDGDDDVAGRHSDRPDRKNWFPADAVNV